MSFLTMFENILYTNVWPEMAFRNFMIEEIDGEFRFLPKEPTAGVERIPPFISINIETTATFVEPLNTADPSQFIENMANSEYSPLMKRM
ncbi:hypothetical protein Tco_0438266 [Tanacetum coccineum]